MCSCLHIVFLCWMMLFACTMNFLFIFKIFKSRSAFVFTEEVAAAVEEDGELFKTGISFTGMIGKLSVSGQQWKYSYTGFFLSIL